MNKLIVTGTVLAAALAAGAWHFTRSEPQPATVVEPAVPQRTLRIALEGKYPPFEYLDSSKQLAGFNIDIANALCAQMNARCEFKRYDWEQLIPVLGRGDADAVIASMSITPEREKQVLFTDVYTRVPGAYIARKDQHIIWPVLTSERLRDKTVGVAGDTTFADYLKHEIEPGHVRVTRFASQEDAFAALEANKVDVVFGDSAVLTDYLRKPGHAEQFELVGGKVQSSQWLGQGEAIAVPAGKTALRDEFNTALRTLIADGTHARLQNRYFVFRVLEQ
ncbi:transporter substrate-binding domain-containing protein [Jeongeupia naejangsanensis]|uniref:Transporter substrate-binding domain-containing protein n=1 Tax=Jeongeupia naejangsanensis TaxID=613195 RepID=A0ABS2BLE5_9NEIS|nr:transporter substrate-binding domain-containing protein [Jeongeupia naejangsanensis]MBM3116437.1 transporter substrate-binding domain-containing protein [Jeongeupia naejangsanensis]